MELSEVGYLDITCGEHDEVSQAALSEAGLAAIKKRFKGNSDTLLSVITALVQIVPSIIELVVIIVSGDSDSKAEGNTVATPTDMPVATPTDMET